VFNREKAIVDISAGHCPCAACNGKLSDPARSRGGWGFCRACGCAWQVSEIDRKPYAATVPADRHGQAAVRD
jgi:hypothetical protein